MADGGKGRPDSEAEIRAFRAYLDALDEGSTRRAASLPDLATVAERYHRALERLRAVIFDIDADGRIAYVSPSVTSLLGYRPEEIVGTPRTRWVHPNDLVSGDASARRRRERDDPMRHIFRVPHKDGHWVWMESSTAASYRTVDGSAYTVAFARDVSDMRRCHEALIESEDRFRALADHASDIIAEVDAEGRFLYISPSLTTLLGRTPEVYLGKTLEEGGGLGDVHPDDVAPVLAHLRREIDAEEPSRVRIEYRFRHGDGSWHWLESRISRYRSTSGERRSVVVTRDITERVLAQLELRASEERMRQAEKLEGLGIMAAGVAHDFNNLLTPILGDASLALLELPPQSLVRARIEKIQRAALRAAGLTRQLLAFTGAGPLVVVALDVSRVVRETAELLDSSVPDGIRVSFRLERDLPAVEADESQLGQVVMNLLTNAFEAIGDGGGRIDVTTGTTSVGASSALRAVDGSELSPGVYVYLEISDDGCGMDAETRERIFDPFFTTKFTGRGLGLAAVLGVVRGHRGAIEIDSEPNRGTRIRVLLPRAESKAGEWAPQIVAAEAWTGSGTVLVVDDDEGVRDFVAETLKRAGLSVLSAGDGREGAEYFRKHADAIRAVLLDATMPESSGEETFDEIHRVRPDVPVILVSGYSETRATASFKDWGLAGFLQKPFSPADLIATLRRILEGA